MSDGGESNPFPERWPKILRRAVPTFSPSLLTDSLEVGDCQTHPPPPPRLFSHRIPFLLLLQPYFFTSPPPSPLPGKSPLFSSAVRWTVLLLLLFPIFDLLPFVLGSQEGRIRGRKICLRRMLLICEGRGSGAQVSYFPHT